MIDPQPGPNARVVGRGRISAVPIWALILLIGVSGALWSAAPAMALIIGVPFTLLAVFGLIMLIRSRVWVDGPVLYSRRTLGVPAAGPPRPAPSASLTSTPTGAVSCCSPRRTARTCASTRRTSGSCASTRRWRSSSARSTPSRTSGCRSGWRNTASASGSARRGTGTGRAGRRGSATRRGRARWGSRGSVQRGFETTCASVLPPPQALAHTAQSRSPRLVGEP